MLSEYVSDHGKSWKCGEKQENNGDNIQFWFYAYTLKALYFDASIQHE